MSRTEPNFILMAEEADTSPVSELRRRALRLLKAAGEDGNFSDPRRSPLGFAAPAAIPPMTPPPARALAIGLVTMPAVFVAVVIGALALFGKPASPSGFSARNHVAERLEQPVSRSAMSPTFASSLSSPAVTLGEDRRVVSIALDGDRVAMHVESPMGSEIVIFDFVEQRVIATTPIVTSALDVADELASLTGAPPVARLSIIAPAAESVIATRNEFGPTPPAIKPTTSD